MSRRVSSLALLFAVAVATTGGGCGSSSSTPAPAPCTTKAGGVCVGAPEAAICSDDACTADVSCTTVIKATSQSSLDAALGSAGAGACIALGPGDYKPVTLPPGVSLLGKGITSVSIAGLSVSGGTNATVRGVTVKDGGVSITNAAGFKLDRVKIVQGKTFGLWSLDSEVTVLNSTISDNLGLGIIGQCKDKCTEKPKLSLQGLLANGNQTVGVLARGITLEIKGAQVSASKSKDFLFGRGVETGDSVVNVSGLVVQDNVEAGIFVDGGEAMLGPDLKVMRNVRGVQIQRVAKATLQGFEVRDNKAVGIGVDNGAKGVIVLGGLVTGTIKHVVPTDIGGSREVGDAINWLHGSELTLDFTVKIEGSGRNPLVLDATAVGSFAGALGGGDETLGVIVLGGKEPSMPATVKIASGIKVDIRGSADAIPVALGVKSAPVTP